MFLLGWDFRSPLCHLEARRLLTVDLRDQLIQTLRVGVDGMEKVSDVDDFLPPKHKPMTTARPQKTWR